MRIAVEQNNMHAMCVAKKCEEPIQFTCLKQCCRKSFRTNPKSTGQMKQRQKKNRKWIR